MAIASGTSPVTGSALLLGWFWWCIEAWSEMSAMLDSNIPKPFAWPMMIAVIVALV